MASDKEERIRAKAHAIWLSEGSPEGSETRHWEMAVAAVEAEDAAREAEPAPAASEAVSAPKPKAPRKRAAPKPAAEGEAPAPAKRAPRAKKAAPTV